MYNFPKLPSLTAVETRLAIAAWLEDLIKDCKRMQVAVGRTAQRAATEGSQINRRLELENLLLKVRCNQSQIIKVFYPLSKV